MADEIVRTVVEEGKLPVTDDWRRVFVVFDAHTKTEALRGHVTTAIDMEDALLFDGILPVQPDESDTYSVHHELPNHPIHWTIDEEIAADDG